jgi:prephenate dehydratase
VEVVPCNSTAKAAQLAAKDSNGLAICSIKCAEVYDLDVIDKNIQDAGEGESSSYFATFTTDER